MRKIAYYELLAALVLMTFVFTGCEAIGKIFSAGVWVGVIGVVLVIFIIIRLVAGGKK